MGGGGFQKCDAPAARAGDMRGGRSVCLRSPGLFFCMDGSPAPAVKPLLFSSFVFSVTFIQDSVHPGSRDGEGAGR